MKIIRMICVALLAISLTASLASSIIAQQFQPDCEPSFPDVTGLFIDSSCPTHGDATDAAHQAQNRAKNSFCAVGPAADPDSPIRLTISIFDALQRRVEQLAIPFGDSDHLPPDRSLLRNLVNSPDGIPVGEGSYVMYVGYVMHAKTMSQESVNCHKGTVINNDAHIHLGILGTGNLCNSVAAEIIPHFRPLAYRKFHYKEYVEQLKTRPVRVMGHLFFDGSHAPCVNGVPGQGDPARRSNWEIHPMRISS